MPSVTLPIIFVELALDLALEEARSVQAAHTANHGQYNAHVADEIVRMEAIAFRLEASRSGDLSLTKEEIESIAVLADEWKNLRGIERIEARMIST